MNFKNLAIVVVMMILLLSTSVASAEELTAKVIYGQRFGNTREVFIEVQNGSNLIMKERIFFSTGYYLEGNWLVIFKPNSLHGHARSVANVYEYDGQKMRLRYYHIHSENMTEIYGVCQAMPLYINKDLCSKIGRGFVGQLNRDITEQQESMAYKVVVTFLEYLKNGQTDKAKSILDLHFNNYQDSISNDDLCSLLQKNILDNDYCLTRVGYQGDYVVVDFLNQPLSTDKIAQSGMKYYIQGSFKVVGQKIVNYDAVRITIKHEE